MKRFASILLTLDGSPESAKAAGCALWLAEKLGATLHVLHVTEQPLPAGEALAHLHVPEARHARVVVHQLAGDVGTAVLRVIADQHIELIVMSARGESFSTETEPQRRLGTVAQSVIERSPVPVLIIPRHCHGMVPWKSILAAVSGEAAADHALEVAVHLAAALDLEVTVMHSENGPPEAGAAPPLGAYADEPYHEYPHRLEEMVERGVAECTAEKMKCPVRKALLHRGDAGTVLLEASRHGRCMLAVGWHGALGAGRAPVLKQLLDAAHCSLLIVKGSERSTARLKVGSEIDAD